jgi:hypothetical protein
MVGPICTRGKTTGTNGMGAGCDPRAILDAVAKRSLSDGRLRLSEAQSCVEIRNPQTSKCTFVILTEGNIYK